MAAQGKTGKVFLERALSKLGFASRTQTRAWILEGKVKVNGKIERNLKRLVVPESEKIEVSNRPVAKAAFKMVLLYKPRGVVVTRRDEKNRPTVFSLLKNIKENLHAVGRLDLASSGVLLLTNDTRVSDWLTDPENEILRSYLVTVKGNVSKKESELLRNGIRDGDDFLKPREIILQKASSKESHLTVVLAEGKNREIRRMFDALHYEVIRLKRIAFGGLTLGTLQPGEYREVSPEELKSVFPEMD